MIKLDKKKNKKLCAILLIASTLALPVIGCSSQSKIEEPNEHLSYSISAGNIFITDNETGVKIILPKEYEDKIKSSEENITVSFNGTGINIDESEITKIRELLNKIDSESTEMKPYSSLVIGIPTLIMFGLIMVALGMGIYDECHKEKNKEDEEKDKLSEENNSDVKIECKGNKLTKH